MERTRLIGRHTYDYRNRISYRHVALISGPRTPIRFMDVFPVQSQFSRCRGAIDGTRRRCVLRNRLKMGWEVWVLWRCPQILGLKHLEDVGGWKNNRTECSHVPIRRRERKAQKFRSEKAAQRFLSSHGQIYNLFNYRRHLISRLTLRKFRTHAQSEWSIGTAAACN